MNLFNIFAAVGTHDLPSRLVRDCTDGLFFCLNIWANDLTSGFWWVMLLTGFVFAIFMATASLGKLRAFGFASTVGMLASMMLVTMGFMSWWVASIYILAGALGIGMMVLNKQ